MGRVYHLNLWLVAGYLAAVFIFAAAVWWYGYVSALGPLQQRARSDLTLAADTLTAELRRHREVAVLTADHPQVRPVLAGVTSAENVRPVLQEIADKTGALDVLLVDSTGRTVVATEVGPHWDHVGRDYFERAMDGAMGFAHLYQAYERRAFVFAAPVFSQSGPVVGALLVYADVDAVEAVWRGAVPTFYFTDDRGIIFLSNRSELVFRNRIEPSGDPVDLPGTAAPFVGYAEEIVSGYELWTVDGGRYLPARALHLTLELPVVGMFGEILLDVAPARKLAALQAAVVAALFLAFGALLFIATQRRRTLAALNLQLEQRVRNRTAELSALNADLRREVAERTEAENMLKKAQDDLIQAGKLSALGQMSAGISHELNQPLTAIQSFAENAKGFVEKGKTEAATQNLGRISELANRMGRIIRNLRAFARQEVAPAKSADLVQAVDAALEIMAPQAHQNEVTLDWRRPSNPVIVRGGDVRLQQVIMNLISNGMDAMADSPRKHIIITVAHNGPRRLLSVQDTGPGISEPEKMFDPFYSTKAVGAAEGMGLGLSISYGLVQSFGGSIRGRNHPGGGAIFTVELDSAEEEVAA